MNQKSGRPSIFGIASLGRKKDIHSLLVVYERVCVFSCILASMRV